ncbi:hypothetical protein [Cohnella boryungensis]|uniref:Uncharacterized protein n=1 Tax=Cohnella boryungensis TaxID=768479 RepID=A0ABV8SFU4_9BACL
MFKRGFLLDTYEKIHAAIHNKTPVMVWLEDQIVDYGGILVDQDEDAVRFEDGSYMLKEPHDFRIR